MKLNTISGTTINSNGVMKTQIRQVGQTQWTTVFDASDIKYLVYADGRQGKFQHPAFRMHRHPPGAAVGDEVRVADWRVYQGNRLGIEFEGTGTPPLPPPSPPPPTSSGTVTLDQFNALAARVTVLEAKL